jgi:hypothetical protein
MFADRYQFTMTHSEVISADVFNGLALATHATNYVTFKLINLGTDASGTTVIATASTSQTTGSAMAANVAFPLTITAANAAVASGETIGFVYDEATTDVANSQPINVVVRYTQIGAA